MIWAIVGFSVAIIAMFCVSLAEFAAERPWFEQNRAYLAAAMMALGVVFWFAGRMKSRRAAAAEAKAPKDRFQGPPMEGADAGDSGSFSFALFSYQYWGVILVILSASVLFVRPWSTIRERGFPAPPALVRAIKKDLARIEPPPPPAPAVPEALPSELRLQGIIFRRAKPSAIINGGTFYKGDKALGAEVLDITRESVSVRFAGTNYILSLRE
ncbi:MAG: hypothetical protein HZA90_07535 [Verrucomicrobia bacterium]|nr:hypothetical protein [Verrucomicrobiota bacterium]